MGIEPTFEAWKAPILTKHS